MGTIKDWNIKGLTEAEDIKKRWKEYTEELYKKSLNDWDNHDGVITHREPDILEGEVKWALGSITTKLVEVMEFTLSYFKSWRMMLLSAALNMSANLENQQWPQDWKKSVFIPMPKNVQTTAQLHSTLTLAK